MNNLGGRKKEKAGRETRPARARRLAPLKFRRRIAVPGRTSSENYAKRSNETPKISPAGWETSHQPQGALSRIPKRVGCGTATPVRGPAARHGIGTLTIPLPIYPIWSALAGMPPNYLKFGEIRKLPMTGLSFSPAYEGEEEM